jgi:hypothetical protein
LEQKTVNRRHSTYGSLPVILVAIRSDIKSEIKSFNFVSFQVLERSEAYQGTGGKNGELIHSGENFHPFLKVALTGLALRTIIICVYLFFFIY